MQVISGIGPLFFHGIRALIDKAESRCYHKSGAVVKTVGGWLHSPERGCRAMLITVTFYVHKWAITVQVKCRNRHSAK